jgi:hypothetical protein
MLTRKKPYTTKIDGTETLAVYVPYGDSIGLKDICNLSLVAFHIKEDLEPLQSAEVEIDGKLIQLL